MGVSYELNWYLVVKDEALVREVEPGKFSVVKNGRRLYPVGAPLPMIIKEVGCVGMIEICDLHLSIGKTVIEFVRTGRFDVDNAVAEHYYEMYQSIKFGDKQKKSTTRC